MGRVLGKLNARSVATLTKPGRHSDGGNLYLSVSDGGARRWVFMYVLHGRQREMGLGPVRDVTLAKARDLAAEARKHLTDGRDPIVERSSKRAAQRPVPTFADVADDLYATLSPTWKNAKHRWQWENALKVQAKPLRSLPVDQIGIDDILGILKPVWREKPETASRLRNRVERVLDAAKAKGHRSGDNPARWRGNLDHLLSKRERLTRGHHRALPIDSIPDFVTELRARPATAARALEFTILTASRTAEVIGARFNEIDAAAKLWRVPAERMKMGRPHEVPLSARALELIEEMKLGREIVPTDPIFHGPRVKDPLSNMSMAMLCRRMKVDATPHGFRSTFRDWAGDRTNFPRDVVEHALAHLVGDETERAYRRSAALEKRRKLMDAWARFAAPRPASNVIRLSTAS